MVKASSRSEPSRAAEVVFDPSSSYARKPRAGASRSEWRNFMESNLSDMYQKPASEKSTTLSDDEPQIDIRKLLKDVEYFGASTWKERRKLENRKVVELGGKPIKRHCTPLSVSKPAMKNQKKREEKKFEEEKLLGLFSKRAIKNTKAEKSRPEHRVLKATEGHFKNGILDVKHLFTPKPSRNDDEPQQKTRNGKRKGKGKGKGKSNGKGKKGGRRKRH